ncbi:MAG: hypothetical protein KGJ02_00240 [Verrucomicrobiota bacterium]|nr:hypothetical protein [Verrucomicrobiota bacterium]
MRSSFIFAVALMFAWGCSTNAGTGAIAGGALGAGSGALIAGGSGALVGGAIAAGSGALIGARLDEQDRKVMEHSSPRTVDRMDRGEPLTINDVIKLSQGGITDASIIRYIRDTSSAYHLSQGQIRRLQDSGVSQRVINYMIETGKS